MIHRWIRLFFRKGHAVPRTEPGATGATPTAAPAAPSPVADPVAEEVPAPPTAIAPSAAEAPPVARPTPPGQEQSAGPAGEPCPACGSDIALPADVELGEILYCSHCGAEVEVISRDPLHLDLFEEEEK